MSLALNIADPTRRGACPTLDAPMRTGDGLLARLRVEGSSLSMGQLAAVAGLAKTHGNGLVEVTARGNVQVRGLTAETAPLFAEAVWQIVPVATGLVVDASPIAGQDPREKADPRPLVQAIRDGAKEFEAQLGPKVSVVADGGGQVSLAGLKADVRLVAVASNAWAVTVGRGLPVVMNAQDAVGATVSTLRELAALGLEARAADLSARPGNPDLAREVGSAAARLELRVGYTVRTTLPFGAMGADTLISLAEAAAKMGVENIRLAPEHSLLVDNAPPALIDLAETLGFVTAANDPRVRVSACIGSAGCASGHLPARALASRLATRIPPGQHLHVSGCAKGCAHPRPADVTLVGRADGIGLVFNGRAGDTPSAIVDEVGLLAALAQEGR